MDVESGMDFAALLSPFSDLQYLVLGTAESRRYLQEILIYQDSRSYDDWYEVINSVVSAYNVIH
jgi:hypothetical protein